MNELVTYMKKSGLGGAIMVLIIGSAVAIGIQKTLEIIKLKQEIKINENTIKNLKS